MTDFKENDIVEFTNRNFPTWLGMKGRVTEAPSRRVVRIEYLGGGAHPSENYVIGETFPLMSDYLSVVQTFITQTELIEDYSID